MGNSAHDAVAARIASLGLRYTANRKAIVDVLLSASKPLTIEEMVAGDHGLAQSSAYRNVAVLETSGVLRRVAATDELSRFELEEDISGHHHHILCASCSDITDFELPAEVERALEGAFAATAARHGFRIEQHRVDLVGTCSTCVAGAG